MNPIRTLLTVFPALSLVAAASVAQPVVLQPGPEASNDVTLYRAAGDTNFNDVLGPFSVFNDYVGAVQTVGGGAFEPHAVQGLVSFTLPALPDAVTAARLELFNVASYFGAPVRPADAAAPVEVSVFALPAAGFVETQATWNSAGYARDASLLPSDLGPALDTVTVDAAGAWFSFDVTSAVQAAVEDARATAGFVLASRTTVVDLPAFSAAGLIAPSGEFADAALRPRLVVDTVPEPAAGLLLAAGAGLLIRRRGGRA